MPFKEAQVFYNFSFFKCIIKYEHNVEHGLSSLSQENQEFEASLGYMGSLSVSNRQPCGLEPGFVST